ncbi:hypothetical protein GS501_04895 [Saccharibacter sp. 17.LH.SD]|uniref:baseplate J/gp47 family protein n=1 Tax=Saccharibacter sp. 17.LH.SD TaxID=2689393 RepID=UPI00136E5068|nr:baseplate J/gp47 family protein [Saccharibacter sp. 17.LH.SD]MXV44384.1 hypothetical protein [Saccharibacter sp. 17.LH.SD]
MSLSSPSTSVPAPRLTDAGFVAPSEQDILNGRQNDLNTALGGNANMALSTPQGQIALSETAILGDAFAAILEVFNGIDPAIASGRMQEAIGRIYFMERRPATPTTVSVQAVVTAGGQNIPVGTALAIDPDGNRYLTLSSVTLPTTGPATLELSCETAGAIACPPNSLQLYQGGVGIASLTNPQAGTIGEDVENRAHFEQRRQATVAANSEGQNASLLGALLEVDGVTDAYVQDNPSGHVTVINGISMPAHAIYCVVEGGKDADIGQAILSRKSPGCAMIGGQDVLVQDTNPAYDGRGPFYTFAFDRAQASPLSISITLSKLAGVPLNGGDLVRDALLSALASGSLRARMGSTIYAYRLSSVVNALGDWAEVLSLTISAGTQKNVQRLTLPINQIATATRETISIEMV